MELEFYRRGTLAVQRIDYVQKQEDISLEHMRVLVRLHSPMVFPLDMIVDVGVSSFKVSLQDDGIHVLHSKVVQGPKSQDLSLKAPIVVSTSQARNQFPFILQPSCNTHQISRELKRKDPQL